LTALEQAHTPATFFVEGQYARQWPDLVRREWNDGFAIGMHTWDHPMMTLLTPEQRRFQFSATLQALHQALGPRACLWFWRPPYGAWDGAVVAMARSYGLTTIMWDDDTRDWTRPGSAAIAATALAEAHPGAIILMHDGPALREETAAALPRIVAGLRARGLRPVTLPQLLADAHLSGMANPHGKY
jgi:peptidoglycan/xylan/chitin deacetylase (PgdA/CDA1 family)